MTDYDPVWDDIGDPPLYRDMDGNPMSLRAWAAARKNFADRIIAENTVGDVDIRTVWLGVCQTVLGNDDPKLFGTAVCRPGQPPVEVATYATQAEAIDGHIIQFAKLIKQESGNAS